MRDGTRSLGVSRLDVWQARVAKKGDVSAWGRTSWSQTMIRRSRRMRPPERYIYWQTGLGCASMPYLTKYVARHAAAAAVDVVDVIVSVIGAVISRLPESRAVRLDVRLGTYY